MESLNNSCRLSIIVPFFNSEKFLRRCVESIQNQALLLSEFEIIMIDDGSTDSGLKIVSELQNEYSNIRLFSQTNSGQGIARNYGIAQSRGEYLTFIDSDDYIRVQSIAPILSDCERLHPDIYYTSANVQDQLGYTTTHTEYSQAEGDKRYTGEELLLSGINIGAVWAKFFKRQFLIENDVKFSSGFIHEDVDFMFKCLSKPCTICISNDWFYEYCWNENSTDRSSCNDKDIRSCKSNFIIASNLNTMIDSDTLSPKLQLYFEKKRNSITLGSLTQILSHSAQYTIKDCRLVLNYARELRIYPMSSHFFSIKSFCCSKLYNITALYMFLFSIKKILHL